MIFPPSLTGHFADVPPPLTSSPFSLLTVDATNQKQAMGAHQHLLCSEDISVTNKTIVSLGRGVTLV